MTATSKTEKVGTPTPAKKPRIKYLRTHVRPHMDECFALIMILRWFPELAEEIWPGSSTAGLWYLETGMLPRGTNWERYPNCLMIGCGKGPLDEHWLNLGTDEPECAATLVAKALGVHNRRDLKGLLRQILNVDQKGTKNAMLVSATLNLIHAMKEPPEMEAILNWVEDACAVEVRYQRATGYRNNEPLTLKRVHQLMKEPGSGYEERADHWLALAQRAHQERNERLAEARPIVKAAVPIAIDSGVFGPLRLLVLEGDNDQFGAATWSQNLADVIICYRSNGNVQILARQSKEENSGICLSRVAGVLRYTELKMRGQPIPDDERELEDVDMYPGDRRWHLFDDDGSRKRMLFCGNATAPKVERTIIPREKLIELVVLGLTR
jgi:hypothetical protein